VERRPHGGGKGAKRRVMSAGESVEDENSRFEEGGSEKKSRRKTSVVPRTEREESVVGRNGKREGQRDLGAGKRGKDQKMDKGGGGGVLKKRTEGIQQGAHTKGLFGREVGSGKDQGNGEI